jgi:hypothetical protein
MLSMFQIYSKYVWSKSELVSVLWLTKFYVWFLSSQPPGCSGEAEVYICKCSDEVLAWESHMITPNFTNPSSGKKTMNLQHS